MYQVGGGKKLYYAYCNRPLDILSQVYNIRTLNFFHEAGENSWILVCKRCFQKKPA